MPRQMQASAQGQQPGASAATPYEVLGLRPTATINDIVCAFKERAINRHADRGGSKESFALFLNAFKQALERAAIGRRQHGWATVDGCNTTNQNLATTTKTFVADCPSWASAHCPNEFSNHNRKVFRRKHSCRRTAAYYYQLEAAEDDDVRPSKAFKPGTEEEAAEAKGTEAEATVQKKPAPAEVFTTLRQGCWRGQFEDRQSSKKRAAVGKRTSVATPFGRSFLNTQSRSTTSEVEAVNSSFEMEKLCLRLAGLAVQRFAQRSGQAICMTASSKEDNDSGSRSRSNSSFSSQHIDDDNNKNSSNIGNNNNNNNNINNDGDSGCASSSGRGLPSVPIAEVHRNSAGVGRNRARCHSGLQVKTLTVLEASLQQLPKRRKQALLRSFPESLRRALIKYMELSHRCCRPSPFALQSGQQVKRGRWEHSNEQDAKFDVLESDPERGRHPLRGLTLERRIVAVPCSSSSNTNVAKTRGPQLGRGGCAMDASSNNNNNDNKSSNNNNSSSSSEVVNLLSYRVRHSLPGLDVRTQYVHDLEAALSMYVALATAAVKESVKSAPHDTLFVRMAIAESKEAQRSSPRLRLAFRARGFCIGDRVEGRYTEHLETALSQRELLMRARSRSVALLGRCHR